MLYENQIVINMKKPKKTKRGRHPIDDKKERVVLFVRQSIIKKHGGQPKLKEWIEKTLTKNTK